MTICSVSDTRGVLLQSIDPMSDVVRAVIVESESFEASAELVNDENYVTRPGGTIHSGRRIGLYSGGYSDLVRISLL